MGKKSKADGEKKKPVPKHGEAGEKAQLALLESQDSKASGSFGDSNLDDDMCQSGSGDHSRVTNPAIEVYCG